MEKNLVKTDSLQFRTDRQSGGSQGTAVTLKRRSKKLKLTGHVARRTSLALGILTERIAKDVARRLMLRIELGQNPADKKKRGRKTLTYAAFLQSYWDVAAPTWKKSTREIQDIYRRTHLDHAFAGKFIDEIDHADAVRWHAEVSIGFVGGEFIGIEERDFLVEDIKVTGRRDIDADNIRQPE